MAKSKGFSSMAQKALDRGDCEIGMHLHAWNSPPLDYSVSDNDFITHPFLIEYPLEVMAEKVCFMTDLLKDIFSIDIVSHRSGRWAMNNEYSKILRGNSYKIDCSVTPGIDWSEPGKGDPNLLIVADYRNAPDDCYMMSKENYLIPGDSDMYEIPVTVLKAEGHGKIDGFKKLAGTGSLLGRALRRVSPDVSWLRPNGRNIVSMKRIIDRMSASSHDYVEFMLHSSELMPGGSPNFKTHDSIEKLYNDLQELFSYAVDKGYVGSTLKDFISTKESGKALT
jgi:hypothetical protein